MRPQPEPADSGTARSDRAAAVPAASEAATPRAWHAFASETADELKTRLGRYAHLSEAERERLAGRLRTVIDGALEVPADLPAEIARSIERLRKRMPGADPVTIAWARTRTRARRTAAIGAVTTIPAMVPGLGPALAALGLVADWRFVAEQQRNLVLEISALFGVALEDPTRQVRSLFLASAASAFGASAAGEAVSKALARQIARRTVARIVPGAGAAVAGGLNYIATVALGRAALGRFARDAGIAVEGIVPQEVHPAMPWLRNAVIEAFETRDALQRRPTVFMESDLATVAVLPPANREELLDLAASSAMTGGGATDEDRQLMREIALALGCEEDDVEAALRAAERNALSAGTRIRRLVGRAGAAGGRASRQFWRRAARLARGRRLRGRRRRSKDEAPPAS
jgi:uncharacterized protein (DUF697 family)